MRLWGREKKVDKATPEISLCVRNISKVPQQIGQKLIPSGKTDEVDCVCADVVNAMSKGGLLEFVISGNSGVASTTDLPIAENQYSYRCPVCDFVCDKDTELLAHLCEEHADSLLMLISEITANTANSIGHT